MDKDPMRMSHLAIEDFTYDGEQIDSLYRLVILAARRANQLNRPDGRAFAQPASHKPVMVALEEVLEGKVWYRTGEDEESDYDVG